MAASWRLEPGTEVGVGTRVIEADGLVVSPGFVDVHTHYDAQLTWDPAGNSVDLPRLSRPSWAATVAFSLAPVTPEAAGTWFRCWLWSRACPRHRCMRRLKLDWRSFVTTSTVSMVARRQRWLHGWPLGHPPRRHG